MRNGRRHKLNSLLRPIAALALAGTTFAPVFAAEDDDAGRSWVAAAAAADAADLLRRQVLDAPFAGGMTVRDAARRLRAEAAVAGAVDAADQLGGPRWRDASGACEVRLELSGASVADALASAAGGKVEGTGLSPRAFADAVARLRRRTFAAIGTGAAAATQPAAGRPGGRMALAGAGAGVAQFIPRKPPAWVRESVESDGRAAGAGLKAARAAEAVALAELRRQVDALELSPGVTVGEAGRREPDVARAVGDVLRQARPTRVVYEADGASVRLTLDLEVLWRKLLEQPSVTNGRRNEGAGNDREDKRR